jgi:hypothetical protein
MQFGAFGFVSKISGKFFQEIMPVAVASIIGTLLVNHYSHRSASPPIVVQSPPPPPDAVLQTLHDEHELIVDYLKRDAEAFRVANGEPAPAAIPPVSAVKVRPQKIRSAAAEKVAPRPSSRPAPETRMAAQDLLPPEPDFSSSPHIQSIGSDLMAEGSGVAGVVRDWVASAAQYPVRAFSAPVFDNSLAPPQFQFIGSELMAKGSSVTGTVRDWVVSAAQYPVRAFSAPVFDDPPTPPRRMLVSGPGLASPP